MIATALAPDACPATSNGHATEQFVRIETPPAVPLAEAIDLWQQEARRGVCDTGRYRMPYFVWGSGPPVVFIHGLADLSRAFIPVMAALRRQFTCIGYDLPAGGQDGARLGAYRHRHLVADLAALLDDLGYRQTHVFGSSFGSTIVLATLHAHPEWTTRAILQGGFAYRPLAPWERILCRFARYWPGSLETLPLRARLDHPSDMRVFNTTPDGFRFHRANSDCLPKAAVARRGLMVLEVDLRPKLSAIRQPVLLICGDCDQIVPATCEQPLLQGLPNAARVELPDCGHYPQYTHAPLVAEVVRQFLAAPACRVGA
ncbi:MAG TPA: alpha/beta hydrolase [Gemmataceae bacterium]|jgi:pimeloyl-ACP methyl ester carboxylesterase|nr:alpha/beta hydrolase [Gemmataceae bacterium]